MTSKMSERATILIVDDQPENIDVIGSVLSEKFNVKVATSGIRALQIAESTKPDLILLDIVMPEMDGYSICRRLKQNSETCKIPVVFVTSLNESDDEEDGFAAGCVDYLTKPINPHIALARINTHLALREAQEKLEKWNQTLQTEVLVDLQRQSSQLKLYELVQATCDELMDTALEEALKLTKSSIGYIYQYEEETCLFTQYAWSKSVMPECKIMKRMAVVSLESTGLWGEAVRQRKPIITNDYSANSHLKKGYPEGHVSLIRHLNVPIFRGQKIVAVAGVGNKSNEYTDTDVRQLELLLNAAWNIFERIVAEEKVAKALDIAEQSCKFKTELLSNLSHELRTPLNGVIGGVQLLQFTELSDEQQGYLQMIDEASANELVMVNNLLELVRLESDGITSVKRPFNLHDCIDDALQLCLLPAQTKKIELLQATGVGLPDTVVGDRPRIQQILNCLLGNAVKFTEHGTVKITCTCTPVEKNTHSVKFTISDTGIGIENQKLERIFDLFEQVDMSNTRKYGGLGLGLAICKRLSNMLGGKIWAESEYGVGSSFHLELPLDVLVSQQKVTTLIQDINIIIAEDDPLTAKTVEKLLCKLGGQVFVARNGREAVALWQRIKPSVVLMDLQMPVMDGYEAAREIRKLPGGKESKIFALTASCLEGYEADILAAGVNGVLHKPFKQNDLVEMLEQQLGVRIKPSGEEHVTDVNYEYPSKEHLDALPAPVMGKLLKAARELDKKVILEITSELGANHAILSSWLRNKVSSYQYSSIESLILAQVR